MAQSVNDSPKSNDEQDLCAWRRFLSVDNARLKNAVTVHVPDDKLRLTHIAEAAALIADYLKNVLKEAFLNDRLRQDAVIRRIQVVDTRDGKAAKEVQVNPREPSG
jgi:hypothetical protein